MPARCDWNTLSLFEDLLKLARKLRALLAIRLLAYRVQTNLLGNLVHCGHSRRIMARYLVDCSQKLEVSLPYPFIQHGGLLLFCGVLF